VNDTELRKDLVTILNGLKRTDTVMDVASRILTVVARLDAGEYEDNA
jgi:hypothetical protein